MATITLKQIPDSLHKHYVEQSKRNRRSLNAEILYQLERAVSDTSTSDIRQRRLDGSELASALASAAETGGIVSISDPVQWQRQQREDRELVPAKTRPAP